MPAPASTHAIPWSARQLRDLRELQHAFRGDLTETAAAIGRERSECDLALNALLGRSIDEAAIILARTTIGVRSTISMVAAK